MIKIIDGQAIAERVKDEVAHEIFESNGARPNLAIVLVGEREDSRLYVSLKQKEAVKVGVDTHLYELEEKTSEEELLKVIDFLNKDESIDGILVQLPLPSHLNADKIIAAMYPNKDVDGFHPEHPDYIISPVLAAILACLDDIGFDYRGKTACIFYNSEVFGLSVKEILESRDVEILPIEKSDEADILISALGVPLSVKKEVIKEDSVLIDVGTTKVDGKVLGDIDFEDVNERAAYFSRVPGGIGPFTIAYLFKNVLEIFKRRY